MTGLEPLLLSAGMSAGAASAVGTIGTVVSGIGAVTQVVGGIRQASAIKQAGKMQQQQYEYQAKQAKQAAGQETASGQRAALEQDRKRRLAQSRALAVGAATSQTMDNSFLNIMSALESEGQYAKDFALFESKDRATALEQQSGILKAEGAAARFASKTEAKSKLMSTAAEGAMNAGTLFGKYKSKDTWANGDKFRTR